MHHIKLSVPNLTTKLSPAASMLQHGSIAPGHSSVVKGVSLPYEQGLGLLNYKAPEGVRFSRMIKSDDESGIEAKWLLMREADVLNAHHRACQL